jgi:hypothetical protein
MDVRIEAVRLEGAGWRVQITDEAGAVSAARELSSCETETGVFPLPPKVEVDAMPAAAPHRALCEGNAQKLEELWVQLETQAPAAGTVEAFSGYLLAVLFGDALWASIVEKAGADPIRLGVVIRADDHDWNRLPWEMMHLPWASPGTSNGKPRPKVALRRVVESQARAPDKLELPLKVLFVVGTDLKDPQIRAGAEYLGLLRRLEAKGVKLHSRILIEASTQAIKEAIEELTPSVIHFICHGGISGGEGHLTLRADDDPAKERRCSPAQLFTAMTTPTFTPPVVLLNACRMAGSPGGAGMLPFAATLVRSGIPLVVGMGGRIADAACRLFTRRFYEALIEGAAVDQAAAEGRRAGLMGMTDAHTRIDWALPVLFTGSSVAPQVPIADGDKAATIEQISRKFRSGMQPEAFCDRLEVIDAYQSIVRAHRARRGPWVLALAVLDDKASLEKGPRYGMTRSLKELASRAVYDGYLPCLLSKFQPATEIELACAIVAQLNGVRRYFKKSKLPSQEVEKLRQIAEGAAGVGLDPQVEEAIQEDARKRPQSGLVAALRVDLECIAKDAGRTPLLLLDEVHKWGDCVDWLVRDLLGCTHDEPGLSADDAWYPIVFTCNTRLLEAGHATACEKLKDVLEGFWDHVRHVELGVFQGAAELLAYNQFLLDRREPLIARDRQKVEQFMAAVVQGVPRNFLEAKLEGGLMALRIAGVIEPADDQEALKAGLKREATGQ